MVRMKCLTTKQDFDVDDPEVTVLRNGRYAYKVKCPWEGKNGKQLYAFKFASAIAYREYRERIDAPKTPEKATETADAPGTPEKA